MHATVVAGVRLTVCDTDVDNLPNPTVRLRISVNMEGVNTGRVERWDEIPLEKVTEMVSRKVFVGDQQVMVQVYLMRGAHVPLHRHQSEQMIYVLQGALRCAVGGREVTVREGDVLHVPSGVRHQAEALEDTFQIVVFGETCATREVGVDAGRHAT